MSKRLVKSNVSSLSKLFEIQKQIAASKEKKGELKASIANAKQTIYEVELQLIDLQNKNLNEVFTELQNARIEVMVMVSDLTEQLLSAKNVLKRTITKSPTSEQLPI